jgi:hypothetical protein
MRRQAPHPFMGIGPNPVDARSLSAPERLTEIAEILTTGFVRSKMNKLGELSALKGKKSLDNRLEQSMSRIRNGDRFE